MVIEESITIYSAADYLGLKYTTAKDIIKKHKIRESAKLSEAKTQRESKKAPKNETTVSS